MPYVILIGGLTDPWDMRAVNVIGPFETKSIAYDYLYSLDDKYVDDRSTTVTDITTPNSESS